MDGLNPCVASLRSLENATAQHGVNLAIEGATNSATGGIKALATHVLLNSAAQRFAQQKGNHPATKGSDLSHPLPLPATLWPAPEPFPLEVGSVPWRYACLFALVSVYGAGLTKDAGGGLALAIPSTMPPEAAQAARDGLVELAGYLGGRLPANNRS